MVPMARGTGFSPGRPSYGLNILTIDSLSTGQFREDIGKAFFECVGMDYDHISNVVDNVLIPYMLYLQYLRTNFALENVCLLFCVY